MVTRRPRQGRTRPAAASPVAAPDPVAPDSIDFDDLKACGDQPRLPRRAPLRDASTSRTSAPIRRSARSRSASRSGRVTIASRRPAAADRDRRRPGLWLDRQCQGLRDDVRRPARAPRDAARRCPWDRLLEGDRLSRHAGRPGHQRDRPRRVRRPARAALRLLPDRGDRRRHQRRPGGARLRRRRPGIRRLLRHLPRPVLRLPASRHARDAGPRQRLPGARGKRLVSEHLADGDPRPRGRLRPVLRLQGGRRQAPRPFRCRAARARHRGREAPRPPRLRRLLAPGHLPADRPRDRGLSEGRRGPVGGDDEARPGAATARRTTTRSARS